MNKLKLKITALLFFTITILFAQQNKFTISGIIKDKKTGETIIGAIIRVKELPGIGAASKARA